MDARGAVVALEFPLDENDDVETLTCFMCNRTRCERVMVVRGQGVVRFFGIHLECVRDVHYRGAKEST